MLYDYKSEESTQDVVLECLCSLAADLMENFNNLRRNESLRIYVPSYIGCELVGMLVSEDSLWIYGESENHFLQEDDTDVLISIFNDGMVFVENARELNGEFKNPDDCALSYFYDGFSHKELRKFEEYDCSILVFGFTDDFCDEYEDEGFLDLITDENDNVVGFQVYRETDEGFFGYECYSSHGMDEDDILGYLKTIGMV